VSDDLLTGLFAGQQSEYYEFCNVSIVVAQFFTGFAHDFQNEQRLSMRTLYRKTAAADKCPLVLRSSLELQKYTFHLIQIIPLEPKLV
jgi:hypothetical protein